MEIKINIADGADIIGALRALLPVTPDARMLPALEVDSGSTLGDLSAINRKAGHEYRKWLFGVATGLTAPGQTSYDFIHEIIEPLGYTSLNDLPVARFFDVFGRMTVAGYHRNS